MRRSILRALVFALLAAAAAAGFNACGGNDRTALLVPTGVRPRPEIGTGAVAGILFYDRVQAPDLLAPPYPLTSVELWRDTVQVAIDTLDATTREFSFADLGPGDYTVFARANFFRRTSLPPVRVISEPVDVGNLELGIDGSDDPSAVHVIYDEATPPRTIPSGNVRDTTGGMQSGPLGVWSFPQWFSRPPVLAAGVHRIRFIFNRARANPINWATARTDTIDAPLSFEPAARIEGAGVDFFVRVVAPSSFAITLDLRRRSISMTPIPPPLAGAGFRSATP